jgi:hypothetical protein
LKIAALCLLAGGMAVSGSALVLRHILVAAPVTGPTAVSIDQSTAEVFAKKTTLDVVQSQSQPIQQRADEMAVLTKVAGECTLKLENGIVAEFNREPAFRWSNSVGTAVGRQVKDAAVFFWMADARPVAISSIVSYPQLGLYQEFQSLAFGPLTAERGGKKIWEPTQQGIDFTPLPNAPPPAASEAKRLIQMKSLAGRFRAEVIKGQPTFPEGSVWQLRLLPRPLMRYGSSEHLARDGAVFAFCQDTDPDAFVMLEARGEGDDLTWHYAMGPLTIREAKGWYDDQLVWSKPLNKLPNDPKRPFFVVGPIPAQ